MRREKCSRADNFAKYKEAEDAGEAPRTEVRQQAKTNGDTVIREIIKRGGKRSAKKR